MCIVPISLMINELKLEVRSSNIILAGLWYGREKERVDIFLKPFVDEMNFLLKSGISLEISGVMRHFKVVAICCCVDSIARAPMQGITGVGGYYCCSWCFIKGVYVNGTVKYPCSVLPLSARSTKHFKQLYSNTKEKVFGIRSYSPFYTLENFSMTWGFVPDYMHCVLLGIVRRFLENWLDADFPGYIGLPKTLLCIDQNIISVKPPTLLRRLPITLRNRKFMKARELENWLLFYSIPILQGKLPERFLNHWSLLVNAIVTLLKDKVTDDEIDGAEETLSKFVLQANQLYGEYEMTYNMHQLLHIAESVRRWGPLWAHTAFPFESFLGKMKRLLKASKGVPQQIFRNLELGISKAVILDNVSCGENVKNFCERIGNGTFPSCSAPHHSDITLLGKSTPYYGAMINGLPDNCTMIEYGQCILYGIRIEKNVHENLKKTNDSYVELVDNTFGVCKNILACKNTTNDCYIVVQRMMTEDVQGVCHLKRINGIRELVAVESYKIKCSALNVKTSSGEYICSIPKKYFQINF
ncbi:uncharacterized protein LOC124163543 isoform X1 [Ischnura elegans]|uniref:uncharacterized protein LOC124163543 isoform X1 n=1 Tax=Ischnura elegans TaxID=197161 RepID=UPI001ED8959B|nr:uncharacterized protein LOC124163543 isoform X1 [Ischnura elegans]